MHVYMELAVAVAFIIFLFRSAFNWNSTKKSISAPVQQLINSLEADDGWIEVAKAKSTTSNAHIVAHYRNNKVNMCFTIVSADDAPPEICWPIKYHFTAYELKAVKNALVTMQTKVMVNARLQAIEQELDNEYDIRQAAVSK